MTEPRYTVDKDGYVTLNAPWEAWGRPGITDAMSRFTLWRDGALTILPAVSSKSHPYFDGPSPSWLKWWMPRPVWEASIAHDALYLDMEELARAWHRSAHYVRRLADLVFYDVAVARGCPKVLAVAIWVALRLFGGIYHRLKSNHEGNC